jgi:hypothetical protein
VQKFVGDAGAKITEEIAAAVDWLERNLPGPLAWIADELIPLGWALIKLTAAVIFILTTLPALVAAALICNLVTRHYGHEIGTVAQAILRGDERYSEMLRISDCRPIETTSSLPTSIVESALMRWTCRRSTGLGCSTLRSWSIMASAQVIGC